MSKANDNDNLAQKNYLAWLLISLVIVVVLFLILPFPNSLVVSLIVIFCINFIRADLALRRAGFGGIKGWYKSFSSLESGRGWSTRINSSQYKPLKFYCMNCGNPLGINGTTITIFTVSVCLA